MDPHPKVDYDEYNPQYIGPLYTRDDHQWCKDTCTMIVFVVGLIIAFGI